MCKYIFQVLEICYFFTNQNKNVTLIGTYFTYYTLIVGGAQGRVIVFTWNTSDRGDNLLYTFDTHRNSLRQKKCQFKKGLYKLVLIFSRHAHKTMLDKDIS